MDDAPWFPVFETNQGTLSLIALVIALVAFLFEFHRANTQQLREREQEIEDAVALIEELEETVADAAIDIEWDHQQLPVIAAALRSASAANAKKPILSLALLHAARIADEALNLHDDDSLRDEMQAHLSAIKVQVVGALSDSKRRFLFRRTDARKAHGALRDLLLERHRQR